MNENAAHTDFSDIHILYQMNDERWENKKDATQQIDWE